MTQVQMTETWPELLSALTHELRLDASAVLHQVELLGAVDLDAATRRRSLAAIEANAEALVQFTDDLTELGRLARGEVRPACRCVAVAELLTTSDNGDERFTLDPSAAVIDADTVVYTDPLIAGHIVGTILGEYRSAGIGGHDVVAVVERRDDQYVDVLLHGATFAAVTSQEADYRDITPEDGLGIFVAHQSAVLVGAGLDVLGLGSPTAYRLRLPSLRAAGEALPA